jgi:hypothetical protein
MKNKHIISKRIKEIIINESIKKLDLKNFERIVEYLQKESDDKIINIYLNESIGDFIRKPSAITGLLFSYLNKECNAQGKKEKSVRKKLKTFHYCRAMSSKKVIERIIQNMKMCEQAANPEKCLQKLEKQIEKWKLIYQQAVEQYNKREGLD